MLLAVPKRHKTQSELWDDLGSVGRTAVQMGREHAADGFRVLANFGRLGLQSQSHGHVHIISGTEPQLELPDAPDRSIVDAVRDPERELKRTERAVFYNERAFVPEAPVTVLTVPAGAAVSQAELWRDLGGVGADAVGAGWSMSPDGFRLLSNFPSEARLPGGEKGHIHLLGGAWLGPYA